MIACWGCEAVGGEAEVSAGGKGGKRAWKASAEGILREAGQDLVTVCRHPVFVCTVGGQTLYTGRLLHMGTRGMCTGRRMQTRCWRSQAISAACACRLMARMHASHPTSLCSLASGRDWRLPLTMPGMMGQAQRTPWTSTEADGKARPFCVGSLQRSLGRSPTWGPKAGRDVFSISGETADLVFGAVTVLTGVFGTLAGGLVLDWLGATMANGLLICADRHASRVRSYPHLQAFQLLLLLMLLKQYGHADTVLRWPPDGDADAQARNGLAKQMVGEF